MRSPAVELSLDDDRLTAASKAQLDQRTAEQAARRATLTVWRRPLTTLWLFVLAVRQLVRSTLLHLSRHLGAFGLLLASLLLGALLYVTPGAHQPFFQAVERQLLLGLWWLGLGVLSSVGLGTGLHTFLLYLGPHIAKVTLTATECGSTDFASYGDSAFICSSAATATATAAVSFWDVLVKVQFEAFMWGLGTAVGELPPYFVARAARAANQRADELAELDGEGDSLLTRAKRWVIATVQRVGFVGILIFASIPNPLFDLAGLTCGHIGVPFWTFFTATAIGKAVVKVHGQAAFVITIFNVHYLERLLAFLAGVLPAAMHANLRSSFETQRATFHRPPGAAAADAAAAAAAPRSLFATLWDVFLFVMIGYFLVSIVNSMAQGHQETLDELELLELEQQLQGGKKTASKRPKSE